MNIPDDMRRWIEESILHDEFHGMSSEAEIKAVRAWFDAQPEAPEPDWTKAPEWAMWWAVSPDVQWRGRSIRNTAVWYEVEPIRDQIYGWAIGTDDEGNPSGKAESAGYVSLEVGIDWRTTLRKRPEVTE